MDKCVFQRTAPGEFVCVICNRPHKSRRDDGKILRECPAARFDCRYRGEVKRQEGCTSCATGRGQVDVSECHAKENHLGESVIRQHRTPQTIPDCVRCIELKRWWKPSTFPRVIQSDCSVTAVTSIAPNEKALDAIQSWQDAGLLVVAIQPRDELAKVKAIYGELVDYYLPTDQDARYQFGKPCVFIWELAELANDTYRPIMVVNSDIEIHGDNQTLVSLAEKARDSLVVGVRHNFQDWRQTSLERHGLDVFFINRNFANSLPHLPLCMGKPLWDYWLPKHAQKIGQEIEIYEEPLFFHRKHDLQWSGEDWLKMTRIVQDAGYDFGVTSYDDLRTAEQQAGLFRESLRMVTV